MREFLDYLKSTEIIPFQFKGLENFQKQGTINSLGLYYSSISSTRKGYFRRYKEINARLLAALREEYE